MKLSLSVRVGRNVNTRQQERQQTHHHSTGASGQSTVIESVSKQTTLRQKAANLSALVMISDSDIALLCKSVNFLLLLMRVSGWEVTRGNLPGVCGKGFLFLKIFWTILLKVKNIFEDSVKRSCLRIL